MALIIPLFINLSSTVCINNEYPGLNTSEESLTETLTPNGNKKNEWDISHYENIEAEDGDKNSQCGHDEEKIDIFKMSNPTLDREVISITVNLKCKCQTFSLGYAMIEVSYIFGDEGDSLIFPGKGTWSTVKSVSSKFGLGWKSFTWTGLSAKPIEVSDLRIRLKAKIHATGIGGWVYVDAMNVEIEYIHSVKIGVFFWASDAGYFDGDETYKAEIAAHVNDYANILIGEGYEKIFRFPDTSDMYKLDSNFGKIKEYEFEEDIIFFYFWGHGDDVDGVKLDSDGYCLNTYKLNLKLEDLDSKRIGFLVEACQSGNFVYHFLDKNYLTIASANYTHDAAVFNHSHEAYFSNFFWDGVGTLNYDAELAFYNAGMWNIIIGWPFWPFQYFVYDNDLFEQTGYMFFED